MTADERAVQTAANVLRERMLNYLDFGRHAGIVRMMAVEDLAREVLDAVTALQSDAVRAIEELDCGGAAEPRGNGESGAQAVIKRPRIKNEAHLKFIRSLPCCVCGDPTATEAAHIRFGCPAVGKRWTGKGEKPDDIWTVPLCGRCHRVQHDIGEAIFWGTERPDPIHIALALWAATGQHEVGEQIVRAHDGR